MNLKEKWTKQNNSVKLLLRKLKRHDTVVVAIAVAIAVMLCGGLIYLSTPVVAASAREDLEQTQTKDNEQTIEKLDELSEYLDGLDKSISESKESLSSFYEKDGADKLLSEKNTEKMTNTVTEKVTGLGNDMTSLHDSISKTGADIERLRELISKGGEDSGKAIADSFTNIYNNLEEIENTYNQTQENTRALIAEIQKSLQNGDDKLSKELLENYSQLLDKLNKTDQQLSDQNSQNIQNFKKEIGDLNLEIATKLNELSLSIDGDMTDLKSYLTGELSGVNGKLDKVFQRVSNGKKLLVSTLLTKGSRISEGATFVEIAKAIENIPVKIVLDKDDVPGKVVYEYHYHTDGQGHECDVEYVPVGSKGGCYTEEYVHTHTDECYDITYQYTYKTKMSVENLGFSHDDWEGTANNRYHCKFCGATFIDDNPMHTETVTNKRDAEIRAQSNPRVKEKRTLKCTRPEGELLGYKANCNFLHGQVVAAKIVFSDGYDKYNTSTGVVHPEVSPVAQARTVTSVRGDGDPISFDFSYEDDEDDKQDAATDESSGKGGSDQEIPDEDTENKQEDVKEDAKNADNEKDYQEDDLNDDSGSGSDAFDDGTDNTGDVTDDPKEAENSGDSDALQAG